MDTQIATATAPRPSIAATFARIPPRQLASLMVGVAMAIALAIGAWIWSQTPDYKVLFSNLSDRDGGAIISALTQMNVPYKFSEGGTAILVAANQVHDARLRLASQGLPKGSVVGFEVVDNQKFGTTQFQEQVNYQRGLEGELAKSVQSLSAVQGARVHLAIPKPSVFMREQQGPSASVLVTLYAGKTLSREQVAGILNLVASSVPELSVNNVSILDQNGELLSRNGAGIDNGGLDPSQLAYVRQIEQGTIQRILDIVEPIAGRNNARVQVTADIDFSRIEAVAETFKPNQDAKTASVRLQQSSQSSATGTGASAQGVPGALSNQPAAGATAPISAPSASAPGAATSGPGSLRKDETINYEVDKTIQHTKNPVGGIKRLTAAVLINHRRQTDDKGKTTATPLTAQELEQINSLVREAMGFSKDRGDSLNIVNTAFSEAEKVVVPDTPAWKNPEYIGIAKDTARYLVLAGVIGYLFFGVLRPLLKTAFEPRPVDPSGAAAGALALPGPAEMRGDPLQYARELSREDPKVVANVVKSWVNKDG